MTSEMPNNRCSGPAVIVAAPCAHVCVRGPVRKAARAWPLNWVVSRQHTEMHRSAIFTVMLGVALPAWGGIASMNDEERLAAGAAVAQTLMREPDKLYMVADTTASFSCTPDPNRMIRAADGCSGMRTRDESAELVLIWLQTAMPRVSRETLSDFRVKSELATRLEGTFPVPIKQIFWGPTGTKEWPSEGGAPDLLINVSRVGFNVAQTQALVYIGVAAWTGSDRAGGEYVLLRKHLGRWYVTVRAKKWEMGAK